MKYKRGVEQRYGKILRKKNQTEILEIKSLFSQTNKQTKKKHSEMTLQQTRASGRQNLSI
jgi:hypothetical protein